MAPRRTILLFSCAVLIAVMSGSVTAQKIDLTGPPPKGMFRIDGQKNPELIPQWLVWRNAFWTLADRKAPPSAYWEPFETLTPEESDLLYREAMKQRERDARFEKEVIPEQKRMVAAGADWPVVMQKFYQMEEQYRWTILSARDRVLDGMSPESRRILLAEIDRYKEGISVLLRDEDLEHFNRPQ
jgi:hypothetical protein